MHSDQVLARCGYNDFEFTFALPEDGLALASLLYDDAWQATLDGQTVQPRRANLTGMCFAVPAGSHHLQLAYQPLARRLYWPSCWMLEVVLAGLLMISIGTLR